MASLSQVEKRVFIRWAKENVAIPEGEENHYSWGRGEYPYPKRRGEYPQPEKRISLSQEERRGSLSQEESGLPIHLGEESRLPCTTHGEGGSPKLET